MLARSYLYCPGNRADLLAKLGRTGADAIILDLEDAVPLAAKQDARRVVRDFLRNGAGGLALPIFVRINPGDLGLEDIAAIGSTGLTGVVAAKAEDAADLAKLDRALAAEMSNAAEGWELMIYPLIESAKGLYSLDGLAAVSPRVRRFFFGAVDYVRDLGGRPTADRLETLFARSRLVAKSRQLKLDAPVAHVYLPLSDTNGLAVACAEDRALGFFGRSCIHPSQVNAVNSAFTPSAAELQQAKAIVAAHRKAREHGSGALILEDGTFVDEATARQASHLLSLFGT
ncbi:HpcH/HpaI aldolase/citrate lyase family protein [Novosphingobium mathurense]|uniref:Citrate lyase subunit beta / citryl-CoA lyase n=1 Tax=Novosphingobium mathurense TaxID=428990 RepID=A0A1U6IL64_9SPHN|nr:CoA ester lyase [Novosphingobium mathurense]SLK08753.1 citrate lyase subunit beta / citryl-CoA lyase [Novosphingobium mathurense]